eukprot:UN25697
MKILAKTCWGEKIALFPPDANLRYESHDVISFVKYHKNCRSDCWAQLQKKKVFHLFQTK